MADLPPARFADQRSDPESTDAASHPGMPRWVKLAIAVVLVLVVALVAGKLAGVDHGPAMHRSDSRTPASQVTQNGEAPPFGAEGHTPPPSAEGHIPPPGSGHSAP